MDEHSLRQLLQDLTDGTVSADEALIRLKRLPFADLGFARVDHHRALRQRMGEAVYGPGKSAGHCAAIVAELLGEAGSGPVVLTRANREQLDAVLEVAPQAEVTATGDSFTATWRHAARRSARVVVVTAGTADLDVAAECRAVLRALGIDPLLLADCGVAGVHRLLASAEELGSADGVVVIAGMEGALASLVGGITAAPVVAVPTSCGYGAGLEGVTALLAMLSSCAPGLTVVGIDNGFGAACAMSRALP
jgi:NCAIR mutase (PurE)-related protein